MNTRDLIKETKRLEIMTKKRTTTSFFGKYKSSFRGSGIEHTESRRYSYGDSIKTIDWKTSARKNQTYTKLYEETREMEIFLVVDFSQSMFFGTKNRTKRDQAIQFCATIALSAVDSNDKVGLIIFSDSIQKIIPAKKGKKHTLSILSELIKHKSSEKCTNIQKPLQYINTISKHSVCFFITDILDHELPKEIKYCCKKNDFIFVHTLDEAEKNIPKVGKLELEDSETGESIIIDSSSHEFHAMYEDFFKKNEIALKKTLYQNGGDYIRIYTDSDIFSSLNMYFKERINQY